MQDSVFQIMFLGENLAWTALSTVVSSDPDATLRIHRLESLGGLFQSLAAGRWHALVIDVHAWNFQGLRYIEKVRSEYPAFPIVALHSRAIPHLDAKATTSGASRCLALDQLSTDSLYEAIASILADNKSQFLLQKGSHMPPPAPESDGVTITFSKNQVITHALNNLLCVISANADLLSDKLGDSALEVRPLSEIKKAARSAAALMRHLK